MFEKELNLIQRNEIRKLAERGVELIPEYFYHVPASTTGKYHPKYVLGEGGLYRHVQAAVIVAMELFWMDRFSFNQIEKDIIITSLILHDGWKQGYDAGGRTLFEHPTIGAMKLWNEVETHSFKEIWWLFLICLNIASHMGQWNYDNRTGKRLLPPITKMQKFVHLCDFIASRKAIGVNLEIGA